ncbi:hypothetical protein [Skermania sp. ID1734]|uniref:hypothetical protein n=1 Tax=Skermania sp. ID1734 TaxID=2597516 RepID=UPI00117F8972|nr:hypothetical protein [Skermania sp. ID1734]
MAAAGGALHGESVDQQHSHLGSASAQVPHPEVLLAAPVRLDLVPALGIAGFFVALLVGAALTGELSARAPPRVFASAWSGRMILNELCISRC